MKSMSEAFPVLSIFLYSYNIHLSVNLLATWHIPEGKPFLAEWTAGLSESPNTPGLFEQAGWEFLIHVLLLSTAGAP